jgi:hypothetical protein
MAQVTARQTFDKTMGRVHAVVARIKKNATVGKPSLEVSDRLRGALVLAVAGLDACVGDACVEQLPLLLAKGKQGFRVRHFVRDNPKVAAECFTDPHPARRLVECIDAHVFSRETFQEPADIEDALKGFLSVSLDWQSIADSLNVAKAGGKTNWKKEGARDRLREIVRRRHQIVHDGDLLPGSLKTRPIKREDIEEALVVVKTVGHAVIAAAKTSTKNKQ